MRKFHRDVISDQPTPPQVIFDHKGTPFLVSAMRDYRTLPGKLNSMAIWAVTLVEMEAIAEPVKKEAVPEPVKKEAVSE